MRLALIVACALVISGPPASADDFPIADVEGKCARAMNRQPFIGECIRREQPAYDLARSLWERLTPEQRQRARSWETPHGRSAIDANPAYYQNLVRALALEMERGRQSSPPPAFRY